MSNVIVLKLISGEEVLAKEIRTEETELIVESPLVVQIMPAKEGYGIGLVPYMHSKTIGEFALKLDKIVCKASPDSGVEKGYLQQVSGIALA